MCQFPEHQVDVTHASSALQGRGDLYIYIWLLASKLHTGKALV